MSHTQEIIGRTQVIRFTGFLSASEFISTIVELSGNEEFDTLQFVISDFTAVCGHDLDTTVVETAVYAHSSAAKLTNPNIRVVSVSPDPKIAGLVARVNRNDDGAGYKVEHFETRDQAWEWIAVQPILHALRCVS